MGQSVYAIRRRRDVKSPVKIGIAGNVQDRLNSLQTGSPDQLVLLLSVPGGRPLEVALHRVLAPWRKSGEWFWSGDSRITHFCKNLEDSDFRAAILRWGSLFSDDIEHLWKYIGVASDDEWLNRLMLTGEASGLIHDLRKLGDIIDKLTGPVRPIAHPVPGERRSA